MMRDAQAPAVPPAEAVHMGAERDGEAMGEVMDAIRTLATQVGELKRLAAQPQRDPLLDDLGGTDGQEVILPDGLAAAIAQMTMTYSSWSARLRQRAPARSCRAMMMPL
jgi:hypothetical protein